VGALDHPAAADLHRARVPTLGDYRRQVLVGQRLAAGGVVIAGVQMHGDVGGQRGEVLERIQGLG
jgi:hypothetical protein